MVRAVVTAGVLLAAIAVLALVQPPYLPAQPASQNAEILVEAASEAENLDTTENTVLDTGESDVAPEPALAVAPSVGALAPDFTLEDVTGQTVSLATYAGKSMFITFFHSW